MNRRPIRLVIIDKYSVMRAGFAAMLRAADSRVVGSAAGGHNALRLVKTLRPDIVIVATPAPPDEALDLLRRIKSRAPKVSVILITASESTHDLSEAIALGCSGYLHQGVKQEDLRRAVRRIARGECILEPALLRRLLHELAEQRTSERGVTTQALTAPEREVLRLITEGKTNREIAQRLRYSVGTVKDYVQQIIQKLEVSDRTQAAVKAVRLHLA
jgi:DNA-binding NarL/FixJ family response regulator